jgi:hypothetical protein
LLGALPLGVAVAALAGEGGLAIAGAAALGIAATALVLASAIVLVTPAAAADRLAGAARVREVLTPLALDVQGQARSRVNVLVPAVDLDHFFGAQICSFNLARRLSERGLDVRIVATDPVAPPAGPWRERLEAYEGLRGGLGRVEFAFAGDRRPLEASPRDSFVATTSWTALLAHDASSLLGRTPFVHLIQEYDPLAFPNGSMAALARAAYRLPHRAVFSTEQLAGYFRDHRLGVFGGGDAALDRDYAIVRNAITPLGPVTAKELAARPPVLVFYARPEPHASRNMFELGLVALCDAVEDGVFDPEWSFLGIGSITPLSPVELPEGRRLELLPRQGQRAYAETLATGTVGLSLIDTPHPSLGPIEMASAGLAVVTSTFENKDAASLRAISPNLLPAEPTPDDLGAAVRAAVALRADPEARARGARIDWPTDWDSAWHDALVERVLSWLDAP